MYEMCVMIQYIGIILLLVGLAYLLQQWPSRPQSFMLFLGFAVLVNSVGYLIEMTADSMKVALVAAKFSYLGKIYIPPLAFFFVLYYCGIKVPRALVVALASVHTAVLVLVLSCEEHDLFYKSSYFSTAGVFPHLEQEYGVVYKGYMALVLCYAVMTLLICIGQYRKSEEEEQKRVMYLSIIVLLPVLGLVLYLTGLTRGYDATAVSYVLSGAVLLFSIFRYDFFDTVNLAKHYVVENLSDGLVVLGPQGQFVYANTPALALFPQLNGKEYRSVVEEIKQYCLKGKTLHMNGNSYTVTRQEILQEQKLRGYMFYLQDITDSYNYTSKLETEVREISLELFQSQHSLIVSLANMVEARDGVTGLHIKHTSAYVEIIAKALKNRPKYQNVINNSYIFFSFSIFKITNCFFLMNVSIFIIYHIFIVFYFAFFIKLENRFFC